MQKLIVKKYLSNWNFNSGCVNGTLSIPSIGKYFTENGRSLFSISISRKSSPKEIITLNKEYIDKDLIKYMGKPMEVRGYLLKKHDDEYRFSTGTSNSFLNLKEVKYLCEILDYICKLYRFTCHKYENKLGIAKLKKFNLNIPNQKWFYQNKMYSKFSLDKIVNNSRNIREGLLLGY